MKGDNQDLTRPIQLYRTAVTSSMISGPTGFSNEITKKFGFTPVQDDDTALEKGWITREEYQEDKEHTICQVGSKCFSLYQTDIQS